MSESIQNQGAPSTLKWLEGKEAKARDAYELREKELEEAIASQIAPSLNPAEDGRDWDKEVASAQINFREAQDCLFKLQKNLREFDKQVDISKRDASEKMSRAEGEKVARMWGIATIGLVESFVTSFCQDVLTCDTPADVHKLASGKISAMMLSAIKDAVRENQLPLWFQQALEDVI